VIPQLHIITDDRILNQPRFVGVATDLLVVLQRRFALHIRAKGTSAATVFEKVNALAGKAHFVKAPLIVNDRVDIALAFDHAGLQLGAASLPVAKARELVPRPRVIGYSAHSEPEAAAAETDGADFILAGSIYATRTHPGHEAGGIPLLEAMVAACSIPVLAIGGVTAARVPELLRTGAYGVAVIRAVWDAADPVKAAEQLGRALES
jgi:thiamine-phosphate pyrophosphorylase